VVIAIIAILAAILFPVFAQARDKARQASCLANEKQLSLAVLMYVQDYDEMMPPVENCYNSTTNAMAGEDGGIYAPWCAADDNHAWVETVSPYIKNQFYGNATVWLCPSLESTFGTNVQGNDISKWGTYTGGYQQYFVNYGMNKDYLQPDRDCSPTNAMQQTPAASVPYGVPATLAQIEAPGSTVLIAETKPAGVCAGAATGAIQVTNFVNAPASGSLPPVPGTGATMHACSNGNDPWFNIGSDGWGSDSEYDSPQWPLCNKGGDTSTNLFDPRHLGGGNVALADGHVKWFSPGQLAAGTNWYPGIPQGNVKITNLSQYLWSLKKTGPSDL